MVVSSNLYIDGRWVDPVNATKRHRVVNPATGGEVAEIRFADEADVDLAIEAAHRAFEGYAALGLQDRMAILGRVAEIYARRMPDIAAAVTMEMGAPYHSLALPAQAAVGLLHLQTALAIAAEFPFEQRLNDTSLIVREPIGVCSLITPWNWPLNQLMVKVVPALLTGCTVVVKPSQNAPLSAAILAEIMDEAGLPKGVFNLVHGEGGRLGDRLASHPLVDMVSFTGSNAAGVAVAKAAADTVKRVSLELGGKSANIILADADLVAAVRHGVIQMMSNSGQSCNAPSRMLVPRSRMVEAEAIATAVVEGIVVGDPQSEGTHVGPIANARQYRHVQAMIEQGLAEGARLVAGGPGSPASLEEGFFARPTIFSDVRNDMVIAREEIFGPVLVMIGYDDLDEAVRIANDSDYGLCGYVYGATLEQATDVARRMRTGAVHLNGASIDPQAPFGGYKQSGNGREWGAWGLEEFLEIKAIIRPI